MDGQWIADRPRPDYGAGVSVGGGAARTRGAAGDARRRHGDDPAERGRDGRQERPTRGRFRPGGSYKQQGLKFTYLILLVKDLHAEL